MKNSKDNRKQKYVFVKKGEILKIRWQNDSGYHDIFFDERDLMDIKYPENEEYLKEGIK